MGTCTATGGSFDFGSRQTIFTLLDKMRRFDYLMETLKFSEIKKDSIHRRYTYSRQIIT